MNEKKFEKIKARLQSATPGPWEVDLLMHTYYAIRIVDPRMSDGYRRIAYTRMLTYPSIDGKADAEFIAGSRQDIEYLIKKVESLVEHLRAIQWGGNGMCPDCCSRREEHNPGCDLDELLKAFPKDE